MKSDKPLAEKAPGRLRGAIPSPKVLIPLLCIFLVSGCGTDPSAVESFSQLAPDQSKLDALTQAYANVPNGLIELDVLHRLSSAETAALSADEQTRKGQITAIDEIHSIIVNYMKALGALANNNLVQTSTDTAALTKGLTALQAAEPSLAVTAAQITAVGQISTFLADAATSAYRQEQLADAISKNQAPFQALVATEQQIISRGVLPDLQNLLDQTSALNVVVAGLAAESKQQISEANARAEAREKSHQVPPASEDVDVALRGSGAADIASLMLLQRAIQSDVATINQEILAAKNYAAALTNIAKAHTALYDARANILTTDGAEAFIKQEGSLLNEAYSALQSLNKL